MIHATVKDSVGRVAQSNGSGRVIVRHRLMFGRFLHTILVVDTSESAVILHVKVCGHHYTEVAVYLVSCLTFNLTLGLTTTNK